MDLYSILETKVNHGELTWNQILAEVNTIKKERNLKRVSDVSLFECTDNEEEFRTMIHPFPTPFQLTARKEILEQLSPSAKKIMDIISDDYYSGKSCNKDSWYKTARRELKTHQIVRAKKELGDVAKEITEIEHM
jgi:hypothetical protein